VPPQTIRTSTRAKISRCKCGLLIELQCKSRNCAHEAVSEIAKSPHRFDVCSVNRRT